MTARTTNPEVLQAVEWLRLKADEELTQATACIKGRATADTVQLHQNRGEAFRDAATWLEYQVFKMKVSQQALSAKKREEAAAARRVKRQTMQQRDVLQEIADLPEEGLPPVADPA